MTEQQDNECPGTARPGDGEHMATRHVWAQRRNWTWFCVKCQAERPAK